MKRGNGMSVFFALVGRELGLAARSRIEIAPVFAFPAVALTLFPLAIGSDAGLVARIAPGLAWVVALLAVLLVLPRLFDADREEGVLDRFLLAPFPLAWTVLAKVLAYWLVTGLPLALLAPLCAVPFGIGVAGGFTLALTLALGTLPLLMSGAVCAALAVGRRRASALVPLLALPLQMPVLVFGAGAAAQAAGGESPWAALSLVGALALASLALAPWAGAWALRTAAE